MNFIDTCIILQVPISKVKVTSSGKMSNMSFKRQIYLSLVKLWISLSCVEKNLMKDKNTGVHHGMGLLCTLCGTLVHYRWKDWLENYFHGLNNEGNTFFKWDVFTPGDFKECFILMVISYSESGIQININICSYNFRHLHELKFLLTFCQRLKRYNQNILPTCTFTAIGMLIIHMFFISVRFNFQLCLKLFVGTIW